MLLAAGLGVTAVVHAVIYVALTREEFAQHTAIDLHEEGLRAQGWDQFWTDKEYAKLAPERHRT
jgi:hypothetical protein